MREMRSIVFKIMDRWIHVRVVRTSGERRGTVSDIPRVSAGFFARTRRCASMRTRGVRRVRRLARRRRGRRAARRDDECVLCLSRFRSHDMCDKGWGVAASKNFRDLTPEALGPRRDGAVDKDFVSLLRSHGRAYVVTRNSNVDAIETYLRAHGVARPKVRRVMPGRVKDRPFAAARRRGGAARRGEDARARASSWMTTCANSYETTCERCARG